EVERNARDRGNAVIALLAVDLQMIIAKLAESSRWKLVIRALCLLKAEYIWLMLFQEALHQWHSQAHGVDVPGGNFQRHWGSPDTAIRDARNRQHPGCAGKRQPRKRSLRRKPSEDRKSTRLNSSHVKISYAVFCLKKKKQ